MLTTRVLELIGQLHDERSRRAAARDLAAELGAVDLIIFTQDPEINAILPAPGFPQTLTPGRAWRAFLSACTSEGRHHDYLQHEGCEQPALGLSSHDGSVLVLLGGDPCQEAVDQLLLLIPLLSQAFAGERAVIAASGHAAAASQAAESASRIATVLDAARRDLQVALGQAQQAIRERDIFVSVAAHELNTPITSLKAIAQLQRRRVDRMDVIEPAWVRDTLDRVDMQATKVARLVSQLLDLARIGSGHLPIEITETEITGLVRDVVNGAQSHTTAHTFALNGPPSLVANVDGLRLEQVLMNVIDNAVKYSPAGGLIEIDVQHSDDTFCISISDEGLGIPDAQQDQIFSRFHRAHATHHLSGLGIGLFVSRQIVELHDGQIAAENRQDRSGSRFTITLPLKQASVTAAVA